MNLCAWGELTSSHAWNPWNGTPEPRAVVQNHTPRDVSANMPLQAQSARTSSRGGSSPKSANLCRSLALALALALATGPVSALPPVMSMGGLSSFPHHITKQGLWTSVSPNTRTSTPRARTRSVGGGLRGRGGTAPASAGRTRLLFQTSHTRPLSSTVYWPASHLQGKRCFRGMSFQGE